jgi:hypothetical protein
MFAFTKKKRELLRLQTENVMLQKSLDVMKVNLREREKQCRILEKRVWDTDARVRHAEQESRYMEKRLREEHWEAVHSIFMKKEHGCYGTDEICGCYYNPENKKWEVAVGDCFTAGEEAERVLFERSEDARCYFELMKAFEMHPDSRQCLACYEAYLKESA